MEPLTLVWYSGHGWTISPLLKTLMSATVFVPTFFPRISMSSRVLVFLCVLAGVVTSDGDASEHSSALPATAMVPHDVGQSYMFFRVYDDSMTVRLEVTTAHLERVLGFGWDAEEVVSPAHVQARLGEIREYVESRFAISTAAGPLRAQFRSVDLMSIDIGDFVQLEYFIEGVQGIPDIVEVSYSVFFEADRNHRNLLVIEHNWKTATFNNEAAVTLIFSPRNPQQSLDLSSSSWLRGLIGLIWLGVLHIWIGIDHILFLMALILPSVLLRREGRWEPVDRFRDGFSQILWIVTSFTIAHSLTLALAGLDIIHLPSRLVESIIAGSIAVAAAANLMPKLKVKEWLIAFGFGLFHGFGFASVMGDIGVGRDHLAMSVLGFNIGVEMGQIAIIALVFPTLYMMRNLRLYLPLVRWGSYGLIAIALVWFGERAFGFDVPLTSIATWLPRTVGGLFGLS